MEFMNKTNKDLRISNKRYYLSTFSMEPLLLEKELNAHNIKKQKTTTRRKKITIETKQKKIAEYLIILIIIIIIIIISIL
jgi:hypothetical protein